jgi:hypothetical protein
MNDLIKTASSAARAFYEASEAFDQAKEALKPLAKQQIEITKKVVTELGMKEHYDYRPMFYYDWIEFEVGGYYEGVSDTPVIECQLWNRGRCGDSDSVEGSFKLSQHIIDGRPEAYEDELRAKLGDAAATTRQAEREQKQRQIAELQAQLDKLQGAA